MKTLLASTLITLATTAALAQQTQPSQQILERPPQFVLISFDGSYSHSFWKESLALSEQNKAKFSYFVSGVYFVEKKDRMIYQPPHHKQGYSDIGWADNDDSDIKARTEYVWQALQNGYDIGSHVNGHFDGSTWTKDEWSSEFSQFQKFLEKVFDLYPKITEEFSPRWSDEIHKNMVGFRAPLLAENIGTQQALKDFNYGYDASQTRLIRWPNKMNNGLWNLGLSEVSLVGTKRHSVAMDYNILYGQCDGKFNPKNHGECATVTDDTLKYWENQAYYSYIDTFLKSYYGNRAPMSVGHHFSLWNRGIYWKVMQRFVQAVCTQPEVQCITHKEMMEWLEKSTSEKGSLYLTKLNQGKFDKSGTPSEPQDQLHFDASNFNKVDYVIGDNIIPDISEESEKVMLKGDLPDAHTGEARDEDLSPYRVKKQDPSL